MKMVFSSFLVVLGLSIQSQTITNPTVSTNDSVPCTVTISGTSVMCTGGGTTLTANGGTSWSWTPGGATTQSITVNPSSNTIYTVTATSSGCSSSASQLVAPNANQASLSLDGIDNYVELGNLLATGTSYTKEAWVYFPAGSPVAGNILSSNLSPFWIYQSSITAANNFFGSGFVQDPTALPTNQWVHVAVTYDALSSMLSLYKNGVLVGSLSFPGYVAEDIQIGSWNTSNYMAGSIDEVRIWNVARTQAQIQANMNQTILGTQTGLVAYYNFNDGVPFNNNTGVTTLHDISGNGHDGTLYNFALNGTSSNWVSDFAQPSVIINGVTTIDQGYSTTLTAFGGGTYSWTPGGATTAAMTDSPAATTTYSVTVTGTSGCSITGTQTVNVIPSVPAGALNFNGNHNFVDCGNPSAFQVNSGTNEAWIKTSDAGSWYKGIVNKQGAYGLFLKDNILTAFDWYTNTDRSTGINLADNTWHHVALTFQSGVTNGSTIYVDGAAVLSFTMTVEGQGSNLQIGGSYLIDGEFFNGTIAETRIWNRVLCQGEIQNNMNCHLPSPESGLVAYYKFNQGYANAINPTVTVLTDASGNGFDGVLNNFTLRGTTSNWVAGHISSTCTPFTPVTSQIIAGGPTTFCAGGATTLSSHPGSSYQWSTGATSQSITVNQTGTYTVTTLGAADYSGCIATATINVTVVPNPVLSVTQTNVACTGDHNGTVSVTGSGASAPYSYSWNTTPVQTSATASGLSAGTYGVTVKDSKGCSASAGATIQQVDKIAPTALSQNVTIQLDATGHASVTAAQVNNGSSDNCAVASISVSPKTFTCANVGANKVILTVTDASGNFSTSNATVTVQDKIAPVAKSQNVTIQLNAAGNATVTAPQVNNGSSDNCSIATMTVSPNAFTCANVGANKVILTVTDASGNSSASNATVTVQDLTAPLAICQNMTVQLDATGKAGITAAQINNGSSDACGIKSMTVSPNAFTCASIGANIVTLTVTDNHGNSSTCQSVVTVLGQKISCQITPGHSCSDNVFTGADLSTIYLGYGPQNVILNVSATGGSSFTYSWTGAGLSCTTCANPVFTPSTAGMYTFTVTTTNNMGCNTTCSITICVLDVRVPKTCGSVYLCHVPPGNPANPQTLSISVNAVEAHLKNHAGDHLGQCNQVCGNSREDEKISTVIDEMENFSVIAYPNPFSNAFHLQIESISTETISIRLYSITGQLLEAHDSVTPDKDITLGNNVPNGMYFLEIQQGQNKKVVKMQKAE